jgi:hypothetical protein
MTQSSSSSSSNNDQRSIKPPMSYKLNVLKQFHIRLLRERFVNNQACLYYSRQNTKFVIPGILITGFSSIASFMATSSVVDSVTKNAFSIGVGILTAGATILQSISSSFGFQSRADNFQKAADSYDNLITKLEFEIYNPNEDFNEFCNNLEETILDIKNNCKYLPPLFVYNLWEKNKNKYSAEFVKLSENTFSDTQSETSQSIKSTVSDQPIDTTKSINQTSESTNISIPPDENDVKK